MASAAAYSGVGAVTGISFRVLGVWAVFGVAVAIAYTVIWPAAPFHGTDTGDYLDAARAIAAGIDSPQPRTPGFPLFLLAAGTGRAFFLISIALHMAAIGFLYAVLRSMGVSYRLRLIFAAIAVQPPFMQKDAYLLTEGLTEFLLVAGFAGLWLGRESKHAAAWSGLALALAAITRPQNQLLPLLLAVLLLLSFGWRRARQQAIALILPAVILLGGLIIHNQIRFGYAGLTYLLGHHLGTRTVTLYDKIPDPRVRDIMVTTRNAAYLDRNPYWTTWYTRPELMRVRNLGPVALARYMAGIHLRLILTHPLAYVEEAARAFCHFWTPDLPEAANRSRIVQFASMTTQVALCAVFWLVFVLWAGLSMGRWFLPVPEWLPRGVQFLYAAAFATVAYTALLSCALDIGEPRYRGPVDLLILLIVIATVHFVGRGRTLPAKE